MDEFEGFLALVGCGILVVLLTFSHPELDIKSGKEFIMDNATYKCEKTNELKETE